MGKGKFMSGKFFDSKCREGFPDNKEKILGYLLGPVGAQLLYFMIQTWLNVYYTDVLGLTEINPDFLFYFPLVFGIFVVLFNFIFGYLIDRTKTKQGKARPYIFLCAFLLPLSGALLFAIPDNQTAQYILVCLSFNLFFSVGYAIYNSSYNLLVPLSSRNSRSRNTLSTFANLGMMIAQAIGSLFPTLIYPFIKTDKFLWFYAMLGISLLAMPFLLLQYYFTRERITEENAELERKQPEINEKKVSIKEQLSVVGKDHYWWILIAYTFVFQLGLAFKNSSVAYYCNWVIGDHYNDGYTMLFFNIIGGLSLALGAVIIGPLSKKFTKRNLMLYGFILYALGDLLCFIISYPGLFSLSKNTILIWVLVGQFIKNFGAIPCVYIWMSLVGDVLNHLEWKAGFRCDGITVSFTTIFTLFMPILGNAIINKVLANNGYITPVGNGEGIVQNTNLQIILDWLALGSEVVSSLIIVVLMLFFNVEKNLSKEQEEIQKRKKKIILASGGTWVSPKEREILDEKEFDKANEELALSHLKRKCDKHQLDFEIEKAKYFDKKAKKAKHEHD